LAVNKVMNIHSIDLKKKKKVKKKK